MAVFAAHFSLLLYLRDVASRAMCTIIIICTTV
jgi:hypothetical protein